MLAVQTVTGPVRVGALGVTLPHEHIFLDSRVWWRKPVQSWYQPLTSSPFSLRNAGLLRRAPNYSKSNLLLEELDVAVDEMRILRAAGGKTVVDLSVHGIGRDPVALKSVSKRTKVNVIASTGYYVEDSHPTKVKKSSIEQIASRFVKEVRVGIGATGVKAGIIGEIGISPNGGRPQEEKVLRAAGQAQVATNAPLTVHTWGDSPKRRQPLHVLDILEDEGVNLNRVYMSHMEWVGDLEYITKVADRGAFISIDCFGQEFPALFEPFESIAPSDLERAQLLKDLIRSGFGARLLVSHDICKKSHLRRYGGHGYAHILTSMKRIFDHVGIEEKALQEIMVDNPSKILPFTIDGS